MKWHFTADWHIDHKKIIQLSGRPFESADHMADILIDESNRVVDRKDTLVIIGDFAMHGTYEDLRYKYIRHLNGNIIWIKGNHDSGWMKQSKVPFPVRHIWHKQIREGDGAERNSATALQSRRRGEPIAYLACSHYPMRAWNRSQHGSINLHGHCHGSIVPWKNQLDVGVDNAFKLTGRYRPLELAEILEIIAINNRMAKEHDYHPTEDES